MCGTWLLRVRCGCGLRRVCNLHILYVTHRLALPCVVRPAAYTSCHMYNVHTEYIFLSSRDGQFWAFLRCCCLLLDAGCRCSLYFFQSTTNCKLLANLFAYFFYRLLSGSANAKHSCWVAIDNAINFIVIIHGDLAHSQSLLSHSRILFY